MVEVCQNKMLRMILNQNCMNCKINRRDHFRLNQEAALNRLYADRISMNLYIENQCFFNSIPDVLSKRVFLFERIETTKNASESMETKNK